MLFIGFILNLLILAQLLANPLFDWQSLIYTQITRTLIFYGIYQLQ